LTVPRLPPVPHLFPVFRLRSSVFFSPSYVSYPPSSVLSPDIEHWDLIIEPHRHLLDLKLGDLWRARDLVMLFVWRDFVSVYKQTILGPLWYLIQPLLTTVVFTVIFGNIAKLPTDGLPQFLFYLSGTVVWSYFASCLTKTSDTFVSNSNLFGKVYFPRLAVPVSILISNLITFTIQFVLFPIFMGYFALRGTVLNPNAWILLTPVLVLIMAGLGLGLGIIVSSLTTKYRDLRFLVQFGVQLLMYATPVIYPISSIPARFQWIILANPMTSIIEAFRYAFLGAGSVNIGHLTYSFGFMMVVVIVGSIIFNRVEQTFMDTL
jgi:lipopolysaccharide transport system permease protein